jgi:hypothetical protein
LDRTNALFVWARDWTGIDDNSNGIADWWEWKYFGNFSQPTNESYDGITTILEAYEEGLDPNVIQFSLQFTNNYLNSSLAYGSVTIQGGVPSYIAVLINDTNTADSDWEIYNSTNVLVNLNSGDGLYNVMVGLRGLPSDATPTWVGTQLTLNTVAPVLAVTNPTSGSVSVPMIQLQGLVNESLSKLTFDVSNAVGVVTNQTGYWNAAFFDTNVLQFTTNTFQCYDIKLTNGVNEITLHATDWAGNTVTTNFSYTLSYAGVTNAPALSILWPPDNTPVGGSNVTIQAQVSDATATVAATVNGNMVQGLIERSGLVWLQNVPLNSGTNTVIITAQNAAGKVSTNTLNVVESSVSLSIDPISSDQLNQTNVTVTGSVSDPAADVWVNGMEVGWYDDYDWYADSVPVSPSGTAILTAEAGADTNDIEALQTLDQMQPPLVAAASYSDEEEDYGIDEDYHVPDDFNTLIYWTAGSGGEIDDWGHGADGHGSDERYYDTTEPLSAGELDYSWMDVQQNTALGNGYVRQSAQTKLMILPSGQQAAGGTSLYLVEASAMEYSDVDDNDYDNLGDAPIAPETMQVNGQALVNSGITNYDGSVSGMTLISAPSGAPAPLVTTAAASAFSFTNRAFQLVSQCVATTPANQSRTNLGVGEQVSLSFNPSPSTNITWSATVGSLSTNYGTTNLFTAPDNATNVTVTVTIGSAPVNLYYKVFAPTGALLESVPGSLTTSTNPLGLSYYANWYIQPDNVPFYNIQIAEGFTNAVTTGYFTYQQGLLHTPGSPIQGGNVVPGKGTLCGGGYPFAYDQISGGSQGPPYTNGTFTWHIPWSYITPDGKTNYFTTVDHIKTLTVTSSNAVFTIQKQGSSGSITNNF